MKLYGIVFNIHSGYCISGKMVEFLVDAIKRTISQMLEIRFS